MGGAAEIGWRDVAGCVGLIEAGVTLMARTILNISRALSLVFFLSVAKSKVESG